MRSEFSRIARVAVNQGGSASSPAPIVRRNFQLARTASLRAWIAIGIASSLALFAVSPTLAQDQLPGTNAAPATQEAPITPAANLPLANSPPDLLFPQPGTSSSLQNNRNSSEPQGPVRSFSGAGLGFRALHPGDMVDVEIFDAPEYSTHMPISAAGDIAIPYAGIFHIAGMTAIEAAKAIASLFEHLQLLQDAHVIVTTQQLGYSVTVMGEVRAPGIIPLQGRQRLIDVLTEAGGITNSAGHVIEVFGADSMKNPTTLLWDPTLRENDNADVRLKPGETVLVSRCGVVYVGGNVGRAGAFPLCQSNHMTISEIIAEAQGVKPSSWGQRTLLLRTTGTGTRLVQTLKVEDILRGKRPDIILQPDDIIYVPPSILKAAGKTALQSAVAFATEAYFYYAVQ